MAAAVPRREWPWPSPSGCGSASGLPVDLYDERLTSFEAEERLRELAGGPTGNKSKRVRDKGTIDAVAASIILEGWLIQRRSGRVMPAVRSYRARGGIRITTCRRA